MLITELDHHNHLFLFSGIPTKANVKLASPVDILRGVSRIPVCGAGMRDAPLRMSAGEANAKYTLTFITIMETPVGCSLNMAYRGTCA